MICPICNKKTSRFSQHMSEHGFESTASAYCHLYLSGMYPECACGKCKLSPHFVSWNKGFRKYVKGHNRPSSHEHNQLAGKNNAKAWSRGLSAESNDSLRSASNNLKKTLADKRRKDRAEKINQLDISISSEKIKKYCTNFELIENSYDREGNVVFLMKCKSCSAIQRKIIFDALGNICSNCDPSGAKSHIDLYREVRTIDVDTVISCDSIVPPDDVDIFMPLSLTAIDYNRLYFHSEVFKNRLYHAEKSRYASSSGVNLLHLFEDEWRDRKEACLNHIMMIASQKENVISELKIGEISAREKSLILSAHHLEGDAESSYNVAAFLNERPVAIIALRKPRHKSYEGLYELVRYCNIGGIAPRAVLETLTSSAEHHLSCPVYTVIDARLGTEKLFFDAGFRKSRVLEPKYWWTDGYQRLPRHKIDTSCGNSSLVKIWGGDLLVYEYKKGAQSAPRKTE